MNVLDLPVRAFRIVRFGARELRAWRTLSTQIGIREALFARVKANLGLHALEPQVNAVSAKVELHTHDVGAMKDRIEALQIAVTRGQAALHHHAVAPLVQLRERFEGSERLFAFSSWVASLPPSPDVLVSVILPTKNRAKLLPRAIQSVLSQSHPTWELLVVNDGSTDETAEVLAGISDPRVRVLTLAGGGVSAARNRALQEVKGSIVAYVDDDNLMTPDWLSAVVWAFREHPAEEVLYGARLTERPPGAKEARPEVHFEAYDRAKLERGNFIDMGVLAHRARLPEARFDESLTACVDWEMILRLTQARPPLALPVIASVYTVAAPNRISDRAKPEAALRQVRQLHQRSRLRILAYNTMAPLITESYITDELDALARQGAEIAFCRIHNVPAPARVPNKVYTDVDQAIAEFKPDILYLNWAVHATASLETLSRLKLPFLLRTHSFDWERDKVARIQAHPYCIGIWAFPRHAAQVSGVHPLVTLFTSVDQLPEPAPVRDLVLSASAGLTKKNWDVLVPAMAAIQGAERRIVMGITKYFEGEVTLLAHKVMEYTDPPLVQANLTRNQVFELLSRAAVLIHTLAPGQTFGMPMSLIEGICAGTCVVASNRPEVREVCGPGFRGYDTVDDIVAHVQEILRGGPAIEAEREANRAFGRARYCDPALGVRFHEEVVAAFEEWRNRNRGLRVVSASA